MEKGNRRVAYSHVLRRHTHPVVRDGIIRIIVCGRKSLAADSGAGAVETPMEIQLRLRATQVFGLVTVFTAASMMTSSLLSIMIWRSIRGSFTMRWMT